MDPELLQIIVQVGGFLVALMGAYFVGSWLESRHFESIRRREREQRNLIAINFESVPREWTIHEAGLVTGSVVISLDYFKRVVAGIKAIFGGRITTYEPLLDRARREAVLRMKEEALQRGFDAVINVRLETTRMASSRGDGKGTAGIEILAFGTGIRRT
jgi:uncharacterized protein YbjQ (UPF0145 family)